MTTRASTPCSSSRVAAVCRASCSRASWNAGGLQDRLPLRPVAAGVDLAARRGGEHQPVVLPQRAGGHPLLALGLAVRAAPRPAGRGDRSSACPSRSSARQQQPAGALRALQRLVAARDGSAAVPVRLALQALHHPPRPGVPGVEVHVRPAGAQGLALPNAHRRRHRPPGRVRARGSNARDLASLHLVDGHDLLPLQRRRCDQRRDVARPAPAASRSSAPER